MTIGDSCSISMRSIIYTGSHIASSDSFEYYTKPTVVQDRVWVGAQAVILPGSVIKDAAIIGANSLFKGVADNSAIYMGNPAVEVRHRNLDANYDLKHIAFFR